MKRFLTLWWLVAAGMATAQNVTNGSAVLSARLIVDSLHLELVATGQGNAYRFTVRVRNTGTAVTAISLAGYESDHEILIKDSRDRVIHRCRPDPTVGNVLMPRRVTLGANASYGYSCFWKPPHLGSYKVSGMFELYEPVQERLNTGNGILLVR